MSNFRRQMLLKCFQLADVFILVLSFAIATMISYNQLDSKSLEQFLSIRLSVQNFILCLVFFFLWHLIFSIAGLYHSRRITSRQYESVDVFKATILGTGTIYFVSIVFHVSMITPIFLVVFWLSSCQLTLLSRLVLRFILEQTRARGRNLRIILLAGTNRRVVDFAKKIKSKPELGYELAGFIDSEWVCQTEEDLMNKYPLIQPDDLIDYMRDNVVDEVAVGLPLKSQYEQYHNVITLCMEQGINVRIIADLFFTQIAKSKIEIFEQTPTITMYTGTMDHGGLLVKRFLDIVLSLALLVILSPIFIITALAIKIGSPGPVFFSQQRLGLNKRLFKLYKFRTMVVDADKMQKDLEDQNEADGPVFKIKDDPRITSVGRFLRISSIDELPQLYHVLKGDMSLVGPRPLPIRDYHEFDHKPSQSDIEKASREFTALINAAVDGIIVISDAGVIERINPAIASDGGYISLIDIQGDTAYVEMAGGCQGCGMADATLKQGVEVEIKNAVPSIEAVLDVTDHAGGANPYYVGY